MPKEKTKRTNELIVAKTVKTEKMATDFLAGIEQRLTAILNEVKAKAAKMRVAVIVINEAVRYCS
jgi:ABC-type Fe3+-hydroxamate transport system substrate-binding protein